MTLLSVSARLRGPLAVSKVPWSDLASEVLRVRGRGPVVSLDDEGFTANSRVGRRTQSPFFSLDSRSPIGGRVTRLPLHFVPVSLRYFKYRAFSKWVTLEDMQSIPFDAGEAEDAMFVNAEGGTHLSEKSLRDEPAPVSEFKLESNARIETHRAPMADQCSYVASISIKTYSDPHTQLHCAAL